MSPPRFPRSRLDGFDKRAIPARWNPTASWLAGVAMSTTSVAVVYAVMIEYWLNTVEYGKTVLAA